VSELILGAATFGEIVDEDASVEIVHRALDAGINTFDTADVYVGGQSEEILGRALAGRRDSVVLCSKVGARVGDTEADLATSHQPGGLDHAARWARGIAPTDQGLSAKHLVAGLNASLRRLGTDYLDVYTVHRFDPLASIDEVVRTLDGFVRSGKVRTLACSGWAAWQLYRALWAADVQHASRFEGMQVPLNALYRHHLAETIPACASAGVSVLAFQALAGGALTGRYLGVDHAPPDTRMGSRETYRRRYATPGADVKVGRFVSFADAHGLSPTQLALRWTLDTPGVTAVLLGASRPTQVDDAVSAADVTLDPVARDQLVRALDAVDAEADLSVSR
jgi:aryl-alcohol dehydrogenase-like predicted oxidoreductase